MILCEGDLIDVGDLPPDLVGASTESPVLKVSLGQPLREVEKEYILASLRKNGGNKARTAELLGISEKTLYNKLNRYQAQARAKAARPVAASTFAPEPPLGPPPASALGPPPAPEPPHPPPGAGPRPALGGGR
jgi:hypothetical protein